MESSFEENHFNEVEAQKVFLKVKEGITISETITILFDFVRVGKVHIKEKEIDGKIVYRVA
ncbi:hypothetical protein [Paenibacillus agilis]|uniref:Uncharacterized protein n=1 Tax=Paenibacillus agilis TaxID=3020863 RepID=A0A559IZL7_9BACL|nr:hypothetical protein [Paenibacillus agilis]TVX93075.1 hypothetical protein FPZ44_08380 [Paenibacillus agilis]